jgi:hypothetical protein
VPLRQEVHKSLSNVGRVVPLTLVIIYLLIDATYWEWGRILAADGHFATLKMARIRDETKCDCGCGLTHNSPRGAW